MQYCKEEENKILKVYVVDILNRIERILELDGCQSTGDTLEELYENLNEAMEVYLETKLEYGLPVPTPEKVGDYSGKFVVRLPKLLHQRLAIEAKNEGVSLNQLAL